MSNSNSSHKKIERRSIALHQAIAAKIQRQPELMKIAIDNLDRWAQTSVRSNTYFTEWRNILTTLNLNQILNLLVEDSERMTSLRQSTPFAGILTPKERWKIYETFSADLTAKLNEVVEQRINRDFS
jgi:hypothetical protein